MRWFKKYASKLYTQFTLSYEHFKFQKLEMLDSVPIWIIPKNNWLKSRQPRGKWEVFHKRSFEKLQFHLPYEKYFMFKKLHQ